MNQHLRSVFVSVVACSIVGAAYGQQNYFAGPSAGAVNTGTYNTFVGGSAGRSNTTGWSNTFLGSNAGYTNGSGYFNVFVGSEAGKSNTSGRDNTFVGKIAGTDNTTGLNNSFFGSNSGLYNTVGSNNSFFGEEAGTYNVDGSRNIYFGVGAGASGSANDNICIGFQAGYNNAASSNTFIGTSSAYNNSGGFNNVFLGFQSGYNNWSGHQNTFIGLGAGFANTSGQFNTALGIYSGPGSAALINSTAIGSRSRVTISNAVVLGSISGINGATVSAKVGIRTTAPAYTFHVNASDAAKIGGGTWIVASDKRLKKDVKEFKDGMELLARIKPVWFRYNGKAGIDSDKEFVGVIAQEMREIAPYTVEEYVYEDTMGAKEKYLAYDANALTYILVNSVKELREENNELREELEEIKQMLLAENPGYAPKARLWQNNPNPADGQTMISYFIPEKTRLAQLSIFDMNGKLLQAVNISAKGRGSYRLGTSGYASGAYSFQLMVDGKIADNKKLVVVR